MCTCIRIQAQLCCRPHRRMLLTRPWQCHLTKCLSRVMPCAQCVCRFRGWGLSVFSQDAFMYCKSNQTSKKQSSEKTICEATASPTWSTIYIGSKGAALGARGRWEQQGRRYMPRRIILWRLARRRQVDGTPRALSRTPVRSESIAGLYTFLLRHVVWCASGK